MDKPQFSPVGEADRLWFRISADDAEILRKLAARYRLTRGTMIRCMVEYCLDDDRDGFVASLQERLRRPYKAQGRRHPRISRRGGREEVRPK